MQNYLKAIVGALIALGGALVTALGDNTISPQEWITAGVVALTAFSGIWAVPNKQ